MPNSVEFFMAPSDEEQFMDLVYSRPATVLVRGELLKEPHYDEFENAKEFLNQSVLGL
jgi:hypothetical protein